MSNFIISNIRTLVPIAIGSVVAWLATELGVVVDEESKAAAIVAATGVLSAVYYAAVHWLEQRWPRFGWLLGAATLPYYAAVVSEPVVGAPVPDPPVVP